MSVQFDNAVSLAQQHNLPPPPDPQTNPAGYNQWLQEAAPYVAEPAYHPQFGSLMAANGDTSPVPAGSFAEQARGQDPQAVLDMDLALLSQDVYNTEGATAIGAGSWSRVEDLPPGISTPLSSDASGFQAGIYTDGNGRYVLAFAGTDPKSGSDWLTNAGQGLGFDTAQYRDAMALAQEARAEWGDQLVITGHSLGGGLASAASLATGNPAVTFNAAGLSDQSLRSLGFTPNGAREVAADGQVRRYNVENDILTGVQQNGMPLPDAVGHELRLDNTNFIKDPIRAHLMPAVLSGLERGNVTPVETSPLDSAIERPGEAVLDLAGNAIREGGGLVVDTARDGIDLGRDLLDSGRDLANGRPIDAVVGATGDVAEFALQGTGNVLNRGLALTGDAVNATGNLAGGLVRDLGDAVGLSGVGDTVGGWIEGGTQWLGDGLDTVGGLVERGLDWAGDKVSSGLNTAGEWAQDRWNDVKDSNWNPGNWF
ncbi:hypothetical protein QFW77_02255 [Luteimonas sp. RD2P54]|uniref:Phospholipase n=1 Tax=Luteimonas endophytica TaxID=3042023 RepID=A0ABT6J6M3_9GAMM|nr:hypothetical protein [Luteimonas endophytica]MDH5821818.1 hypothetical protein [Luteimonas endophytica]